MGNSEQYRPSPLRRRLPELRSEFERQGRWKSPDEVFETVTLDRRRPHERLSEDARQTLLDQATGPLRPGAYVEIGFGSSPYPENGADGVMGRLLGARTFSEESPYVGFEAREHLVGRNIAEIRHELKQYQPYAELLVGEGQHLPLSDRTAAEVFMGDVLIEYHKDPEAKKELLEEVRRVLEPGGLLIIGSSTIGNLADGKVTDPENTHKHTFAEVGLILDELGFRERMLVDDTMPEGEEVNQTLGWNGMNFMIARIPSEQSEPADVNPRPHRR